MPELRNHHGDGSELDHKSAEELDKLLKAYVLSPDDADMADVLSILEVMGKRENENPSGSYTDVDAAWASFRENYSPRDDDGKALSDDDIAPVSIKSPRRTRPKRRRSLLYTFRILAAVLVLLLSGTLVAEALGYNLWAAVAKWTNETFRFTAGSTAAPNTDAAQPALTWADFNTALSDYGMDEALAPERIPDGFTISRLAVTETPRKTTIIASCLSNEKSLRIAVTKLADGTNGTYEKDGGETVVYEKDGVLHYIISNEGQMTAVWLNDNYECSISGDITEQVIKDMIDSIYER